MKKIVIFLGVFLFGDVSDAILKIQQIEHIKKKFLKIDYNIFSPQKKVIISKPKIIKPIKKEVKKIKLNIYAIFNNKVNINSKWYKIGDIIEGFKIIKILDNGVILEKNSKIVILKIRKSILKVSE